MKNSTLFYLIFFLVFNAGKSRAQLGISDINSPPNAAAVLDLKSTNKGFLIPRMTSSQRTGIPSPPQGLNVFDTQTKSFWYFDGLVWKEMNSNAVASIAHFDAVTICCQSWMTKNLDVTTYRNGDPIPQITDAATWGSTTTGAWCYYANLAANGPIYGKLYNIHAVNDPRGLAPEGWHIPTLFEVETLISCLGAGGGGKLKETGTAHWTSPNTGATNTTGFNGVGSGWREGGTFSQLKIYGLNWIKPISNITVDLLLYDNGTSSLTTPSATVIGLGIAVRCIRDY